MKPIQSDDGTLRYSVPVTHRIGRTWLIAFAAYYLASTGRLPVGSQSDVLEVVKQELRVFGSDRAYSWRNVRVNSTLSESFLHDATEYINKLFPELMNPPS